MAFFFASEAWTSASALGLSVFVHATLCVTQDFRVALRGWLRLRVSAAFPPVTWVLCCWWFLKQQKRCTNILQQDFILCYIICPWCIFGNWPLKIWKAWSQQSQTFTNNIGTAISTAKRSLSFHKSLLSANFGTWIPHVTTRMITIPRTMKKPPTFCCSEVPHFMRM